MEGMGIVSHLYFFSVCAVCVLFLTLVPHASKALLWLRGKKGPPLVGPAEGLATCQS